MINDQEKDLATLLEDVRTIKKILQNEDAPLPQVWKAMLVAAPSILAVGLVQYFVPLFRNLDFDGKLLYLWLPAFCVVCPVVLAILFREIRRSGKGFLGQGRIRHLLFARFIIPPAALVIVWVSSRNPVFPAEGVFLLVTAMWLTVVEQALPSAFRTVPFLFLFLGLLELGFHLGGPEATLFDTALAAGALTFAGILFRAQAQRNPGGR